MGPATNRRATPPFFAVGERECTRQGSSILCKSLAHAQGVPDGAVDWEHDEEKRALRPGC